MHRARKSAAAGNRTQGPPTPTRVRLELTCQGPLLCARLEALSGETRTPPAAWAGCERKASLGPWRPPYRLLAGTQLPDAGWPLSQPALSSCRLARRSGLGARGSEHPVLAASARVACGSPRGFARWNQGPRLGRRGRPCDNATATSATEVALRAVSSEQPQQDVDEDRAPYREQQRRHEAARGEPGSGSLP